MGDADGPTGRADNEIGRSDGLAANTGSVAGVTDRRTVGADGVSGRIDHLTASAAQVGGRRLRLPVKECRGVAAMCESAVNEDGAAGATSNLTVNLERGVGNADEVAGPADNEG